MKRSHSYPRPNDFPGTERDWYAHLLSIELDTGGGGTINFDPIVDPEILYVNEEALLAQPLHERAKSQSEQLAEHILKRRPGVAKKMLESEV